MRKSFKCIKDGDANVRAVKSKPKTFLTIFTALVNKQSEYNEVYPDPESKNFGSEEKVRSPSPLNPNSPLKLKI